MTALRLILFDCDGTLVDTASTIVDAFKAGFRAVGAPPPEPKRILSIVGLSLPVAVRELCNGYDVDPDRVCEAYRGAYSELVSRRIDPLFPGTCDALDAIDTEGTLMGIVTGKSRRGLTRILAEHRLADRFVTTHTADDAASKPSPDMVHHALRATGVDPARTVVVGDTTYDLDMAHAAGVHAIAVTWGNHDEARLNKSRAHATAHRMAELPALIDRLTLG